MEIASLLLRTAYLVNIAILVPVVATLWFGSAQRILGPEIVGSRMLRLLIAALWAGILVCSAIGLAWPRAMAGILVLQVVYKLLWLATAAAPAWRAGEPIPWGPTITFIAIVLTWPIVLFLSWPSVLQG
jgi:hypothetical protein